jgi:hypothetical protein
MSWLPSNTAEGWSLDATEEIARAVQELADAEGHASKPAQQFVERIVRGSSGTY